MPQGWRRKQDGIHRDLGLLATFSEKEVHFRVSSHCYPKPDDGFLAPRLLPEGSRRSGLQPLCSTVFSVFAVCSGGALEMDLFGQFLVSSGS